MGKIGKKIKVNLKWFGGAFFKWAGPLLMQKTIAEMGRLLSRLGRKKK